MPLQTSCFALTAFFASADWHAGVYLPEACSLNQDRTSPTDQAVTPADNFTGDGKVLSAAFRQIVAAEKGRMAKLLLGDFRGKTSCLSRKNALSGNLSNSDWVISIGASCTTLIGDGIELLLVKLLATCCSWSPLFFTHQSGNWIYLSKSSFFHPFLKSFAFSHFLTNRANVSDFLSFITSSFTNNFPISIEKRLR